MGNVSTEPECQLQQAMSMEWNCLTSTIFQQSITESILICIANATTLETIDNSKIWKPDNRKEKRRNLVLWK